MNVHCENLLRIYNITHTIRNMPQFHFYPNVQFETNPKKCCIRRIICACTKVFHGKCRNIFISYYTFPVTQKRLHLCSYILNYTNYFSVFFLTLSLLDILPKTTFNLENTIAEGLKIVLLIFQDQIPFSL